LFIFCSFRVQIYGNDQTVETQDFSKNQDENHSDKESGLLSSSSDSSVTDDSDSEASSQSRESHGQASTEMDETSGEDEE
jgi:hypothetical protein